MVCSIVMRAKCVNCHNSPPQSPKIDWKTGDIRGVLEVILPIQSGREQRQKGLLESLTLMTVIALTGIGLLSLVIRGLRQSISTAHDLAKETDIANKKLEEEVSEKKHAQNELQQSSSELEHANVELLHEIVRREQTEEEITKTLEKSEIIRKELEEYDRFYAGRELRMIELKCEVNELLKAQGESERYELVEAPDDVENDS